MNDSETKRGDPNVRQVARDEWQEKGWGRTRCVHRGYNVEIWELEVKKDHLCSIHRHERKWNRFFIFSGVLLVNLYGRGDSDPKDEDAPTWNGDHGPGESMVIPPTEWHRFHARTDCHLIEVYWTADIDPEDIDRAVAGGFARPCPKHMPPAPLPQVSLVPKPMEGE